MDNLKLPFTSLILKYDYFVDPKDFLLQDNISTTLPNGNKLIVHKNGSLKVLDKTYPFLSGGIANMIAISNEEIITTGTLFCRRNFIKDTILNTYGYNEAKYIGLLPNRKFFSYFNQKIKYGLMKEIVYTQLK